MSKPFDIPDYILAIKSFKPTLAGQVSLLGFKPEAIRKADDKLRTHNADVSNPMAYFRKVANSWHEERNVEIDYQRVHVAQTQAGVSSTDFTYEMGPNGRFTRPSMIKMPINKKETMDEEKRSRIPMFVMPEKVVRPSSEVAIEAANFITLKDQTPSWMQEFLQQRIIKGRCEPDYIEAVARENKPTNAELLLEPTKTSQRPSLANIAASFTPVPFVEQEITPKREIQTPLVEEQAPIPIDANEDYEECWEEGRF